MVGGLEHEWEKSSSLATHPIATCSPQAQLTSHCPPKDAAGCSEVVGATGWVGVHALAEEGQVLHWGKRGCQASAPSHMLPSSTHTSILSQGPVRERK